MSLDIRRLAETVRRIADEQPVSRFETKADLQQAASVLFELAGDPKAAPVLCPSSSTATSGARQHVEDVVGATEGPHVILRMEDTPPHLQVLGPKEDALDVRDYSITRFDD